VLRVVLRVLVLCESMKVTDDDESILVISTSHRWRELAFLIGSVLLTSSVVLLLPISLLTRAAFVVIVAIVAAVNVSDDEECKIDKKKGSIVIRKFGPFVGERVYQKSLDELSEVTTEKLQKKPKYTRVMLWFKDGIRMPLTDSFFPVAEDVKKVATIINSFVNM